MSNDKTACPPVVKVAIGIVFGAFCIFWIIADKGYLDSSSNSKPTTQAELREVRIQDLFSGFDGSHRNSIVYIKSVLHNPDAFEHVSTVWFDNADHLIVKTTYRAENGFGAIRTGWIKTKVSLSGTVLDVLDQSGLGVR